ncbi:MAG: TetR-like C-terminal domain-containing protein [Chloroflexota bacterium]
MKPIQKITVTEICRTADINRNTFYAHYYSPENLLTQIEDELFQQLAEPIHSSVETETLILQICQLLYANKELSTILFSEHGNKDFLERVKVIGQHSFLREWQAPSQQYPAESLEKLYAFVANGTVGIIQEWIQHDMRESPEAIAGFISQTIALLQTAVLQQ